MRRPSPAMIVALVALFVGLGGGAYAALKLPKNSVGAKQIRKHAVTPSKVAPSTARRFKGAKGDPGDPGTPGQQGETGPPGPGAKIFTADPSVTASDAYTVLGSAGAFTLYVRCRDTGGGMAE